MCFKGLVYVTDPYAKTEYTSGTTYKQKTRHPEKYSEHRVNLTLLDLKFYFTKIYLADNPGTLTLPLNDSPEIKSVPEPPISNDSLPVP